MKTNKIQKKKIWLGVTVVLLLGFFLITNIDIAGKTFTEKNIGEKRMEFVSEKDDIIKGLIVQGKYACCLEKPCTYCIEKTPGHGEGATCNCLEDVVTGVHPCGECIGEILEGHGNPYLAGYFAKSIAEEVGEQHLDTLKQIISEKYEIPVDEQL